MTEIIIFLTHPTKIKISSSTIIRDISRKLHFDGKDTKSIQFHSLLPLLQAQPARKFKNVYTG